MSSRKRRAVKPVSTVFLSQSCPACDHSGAKDVGEVWIECEGCQIWHHWACVSLNPLDEIDNVDKWWCESCVTISPHRVTTYKVAQRKSSRKSTQLDYANFAAHLPSEPNKWLRVLETRASTVGAFKHYTPDQITPEWLYTDSTAMTEPFIIETPEGLGMAMPHPSLSISAISDIVGGTTPLEVIDVASQSSLPGWTLSEWATYYEDRNRDKVRNVISLEVSETPLSKFIVAPDLVRQLDWVEQFWGKKVKGKYPTVSKYCLMSVANSWTDWHIDFAGSSVYYHILRGSKTFLFIPPTVENLKAYELWSGDAEKQENTWLGDSVSEVFRVDLIAGNTMIIPTGWIHAVFTPTDSLVIGGNFVHSLNIATQLRVYEIEILTKVPRKFRFPRFVYLCWLVAVGYTTRLQKWAGLLESTALPIDMPVRILEGLLVLSTFLIEQAGRVELGAAVSTERRRIAKENIPVHIIDAGALSRSFRTLVLKALGREEDELCRSNSISSAVDTTVVGLAAVKVESVSVATTKGTKRALGSISAKNGGSNLKKFKNWVDPNLSKSLSPPVNDIVGVGLNAAEEGVIIKREVIPLHVDFSTEFRIDPLEIALGAREAAIKTCTTKNIVVRRFGTGMKGEVTRIETRSVVTVVETVTFGDVVKASTIPSPSATATFFDGQSTKSEDVTLLDLLSATAATLPTS